MCIYIYIDRYIYIYWDRGSICSKRIFHNILQHRRVYIYICLYIYIYLGSFLIWETRLPSGVTISSVPSPSAPSGCSSASSSALGLASIESEPWTCFSSVWMRSSAASSNSRSSSCNMHTNIVKVLTAQVGVHLFMVYIYIDVDRVEMGGEINLKQSIIFFHMCMYTHTYIYIYMLHSPLVWVRLQVQAMALPGPLLTNAYLYIYT